MRERYFVSLAVAILVQHDVVPFFSSPEGAPFSSAATSPAASVSAPAPARGDVTGAAPAERYRGKIRPDTREHFQVRHIGVVLMGMRACGHAGGRVSRGMVRGTIGFGLGQGSQRSPRGGVTRWKRQWRDDEKIKACRHREVGVVEFQHGRRQRHRRTIDPSCD